MFQNYTRVQEINSRPRMDAEWKHEIGAKNAPSVGQAELKMFGDKV